jgi:3-hydroxy-9,10-secoandrosta-1,3,5(10)-triene-9,17-dione monooxygenase reductase component
VTAPERGTGASLHYGDPWAEPPASRDPVRRLRGRLVLPVTVWTARACEGEQPLGLTVSSVLFGQGNPGVLAGLLSPTTDLAAVLEHPGTPFAVHVLGAAHRRLAQHFAGELPAPPEMLATSPSGHGPLLEAVLDRALCRTSASRSFGWSLLVEAVVEEVQVTTSGKAMAWHRGGFRTLD